MQSYRAISQVGRLRAPVSGALHWVHPTIIEDTLPRPDYEHTTPRPVDSRSRRASQVGGGRDGIANGAGRQHELPRRVPTRLGGGRAVAA